MENQEYLRYSESSSDKIILQNNQYVVQKTITKRGYDHILDRWNVISVTKKILCISSAGLFKELVQTIYVKRSALNDMLQSVSLFLKLTRKIEVLDKSNNIFIKESDDRVWQTDLKITCMIPMNNVPAGLKITDLKEEKISQKELTALNEQLNNPKILLKPQIIEELPNGERRILVS